MPDRKIRRRQVVQRLKAWGFQCIRHRGHQMWQSADGFSVVLTGGTMAHKYVFAKRGGQKVLLDFSRSEAPCGLVWCEKCPE